MSSESWGMNEGVHDEGWEYLQNRDPWLDNEPTERMGAARAEDADRANKANVEANIVELEG